jgi:Isocitrate/isopropylmalate dehydrogenase
MHNSLLIESAVKHFEQLLRNQLSRVEAMEMTKGATDFTVIENIVIGLCPGDGIGPIIFETAKKVLEHLLSKDIEAGKIELRNIEGLTLKNRLAFNQTVPEDVLEAIKNCHVFLKGPTTTPEAGSGMMNLESANVTIRKELDLYSNIRPVKVPEKNIDWIFFRENTEGEYALGSQGIEIAEKLAFDFKVTTDAGTKRIARAAFEYAKKNGRTELAVVTKANIMKKTDGKFLTICREIAKEYPEINVSEWYVDIMSANLINPDIQSKLQVFLLPNLYGDIITDEAAQIQGGIGTAGSANTGDKYAMFEAIHGSAPRMISEGLGAYANPASILRAVEMLLRHIGKIAEANKLANALDIGDKEKIVVVTGTKDGATCKEFTDYIINKL